MESQTYQEIEPFLHEKILIILSANWCKPCMVIKEGFKKYMETHSIKDAMIIQIDYDHMDEELSEWLNVKKIPTFYMIKNGDTQQSVTSSNWEVFQLFLEENFHVESKEMMITDDF